MSGAGWTGRSRRLGAPPAPQGRWEPGALPLRARLPGASPRQSRPPLPSSLLARLSARLASAGGTGGRWPSSAPVSLSASTATATPCAHSHGTGWTHRPRTAPGGGACPPVATHPLSDGRHGSDGPTCGRLRLGGVGELGTLHRGWALKPTSQGCCEDLCCGLKMPDGGLAHPVALSINVFFVCVNKRGDGCAADEGRASVPPRWGFPSLWAVRWAGRGRGASCRHGAPCALPISTQG